MPQVTTCATVGYSHYPLEIAAQQIAALGFRQVEITHLAFYSLHYLLDQVNAPQVATLLAGYGLSATAMNSPLTASPRIDDMRATMGLSSCQRRPSTRAATARKTTTTAMTISTV